jgi:hypothetical protein
MKCTYVFGLLVAASLSHANFVSNGSFAGGSLSDWTVSGSDTWYPWTAFGGGTGFFGTPLAYDAVGTGANTGVQGMTFLTQWVAGLTEGESYLLSLDLASGSADNHVGASINGNTVFSAEDTSNLPWDTEWQHVSGLFTAGASNELVIEGFDNPDVIYMSHITVEAVPEPSCIAALAVGLAAVIRRKRTH